MVNNFKKTFISILLLLSSAVLAFLSYPQFDFGFFIWVALVPLFFVVEGKTIRKAFGYGFLAGLIFFVATCYWFIHMSETSGVPFILSVLAVVGITVYCACYWGAFAAGVVVFSHLSTGKKLLIIPSLWVVLEFVRARAFSGFGWVCLGHSQYQVLEIIQIADIVGVYGISFLIVLVNCFLKIFIEHVFMKKVHRGHGFLQYSVVVGCVVLVVLGYGFWKLNQPTKGLEKIKVAIVQGNIYQQQKWDPSNWPMILDKYIFLTQEALKTKADLVIWPETSFPGYLWDDVEMFQLVQDFVREEGVPLLMGAVIQDGDCYFNAALLLDNKGQVSRIYKKTHLVPFGEYIPLRKVIPFLSDLIPIGDFCPGKERTLLPLMQNAGTFKYPQACGVLICFEDTVASVARGLTKKGAKMLVNITNDAWFMDTKEPFLHMQAGVFQAVTNRRTLVRTANTGVSCFIDQFGRITRFVKDANNKKTYIAGFSVAKVELTDKITFYTKFGDIFTYLCFGCILLFIFVLRDPKRGAQR